MSQQEKVLKVYVPRPQSYAAQAIAKGSAIVGRPVTIFAGHPQVEIYYEGAIYRHPKPGLLECLKIAADRLWKKYPTSAKMVVDEEDLIHVGYFGTSTISGPFIRYVNPQPLEAWTQPVKMTPSE